MRLSMDQQVLEAAATLLTGLALGVVYSVLAAVRARRGRVAGAALDILFCTLFAAALFLLGMGAGRGRLRLYMPLLALGGVGAWTSLFGAATVRRLSRAFDCFAAMRRKLTLPIAKTGRKIEKSLKSIFSKLIKWFTITSKRATKVRLRTEAHAVRKEAAYEAEAFQYIYEDCRSGADCVRGDQPCEREKPHRGGRSGSGCAAGKSGRRTAEKRGA
ncbi:MAG: hypothetical protein E7472_05675 [Ruminococcaceae bacterium]|nr:hypothetical protein [Oscillospiraceae bacterium]